MPQDAALRLPGFSPVIFVARADRLAAISVAKGSGFETGSGDDEGHCVTDEVTNQPPPLYGHQCLARRSACWCSSPSSSPAPVRKDLDGLGRFVLSPEAQDLARLANTETPKLKTHDRQGRRIDLVEFHPAYHALMRRSIAGGLHSSIWENGAEETGKRHQVRAARFYLTAELECGHLCPITMTSASLAALMASPKLFREWAPRVTTRKYDQAQKPPVEKAGLTLGMGMTEKQGGTDVRANTTRAERAGGGFYRLTGHKWFMSAPMSDAFLVLAQAQEGLSCFLVPRLLGDGDGQRLPLPAAEGQARQPLQRLVRSRIRRRHRRDGRRAGRRHQDHHGHGDADPARLRGGLVGADARRAGRGRPPRPPPPGVRRDR